MNHLQARIELSFTFKLHPLSLVLELKENNNDIINIT